MMKSYKPKMKTIEAYSIMQTIAIKANTTIAEMAKDLGFGCPYRWMTAILKGESKELIE
jgi:hypothetical protein